MSIEELDKMIPVRPPTVKRNTNPIDQYRGVSIEKEVLFIVANHLNTFTPVGIAIIMVAAVK
jgi:hypothetical protein